MSLKADRVSRWQILFERQIEVRNAAQSYYMSVSVSAGVEYRVGEIIRTAS